MQLATWNVNSLNVRLPQVLAWLATHPVDVLALQELNKQNAELGGDDVHSKAHHMRDNVIPAMTAVRTAVDKLEKALPDDTWPLPRYREMLCIR